MQFAADFPGRTRTLSVVSGPASVIQITNPSPVPQKDRLGSSASAAMIEYWNRMEKNAPQAGTQGLNAALSSFDLERDGVLQRIKSPSLIITADRSALQSVDKVRKYQHGDPRFAARRAAQRRVSPRRRETGRVRRQRARVHSRERLARPWGTRAST